MNGFEHRMRTAAVAGLVAIVALAGCSRNDPPKPRSDSPPASTSPGTTGNGNTGMTGTTGAGSASGTSAAGDTAVTARVKAALLADPLVKGLAIEVETNDGVVALKGGVSGPAERAKALEITRSVQGVRSVTDALKVN